MNQSVTPDFDSLLAAVSDAGLFTSTATVQRFNGELGPSGAEARGDDANWDNLTDHVDLACMVARDVRIGSEIKGSQEVKTQDAIAVMNHRHVLLNGLFPLILQSDRLIVTTPDGLTATLDILGAEPASQGIMTRLSVREYAL